MNKNQINNNLNISTAINGAGIGLGAWNILANMPYLITHPNINGIISMLMPIFILVYFCRRYKEQKAINNQIIKEHEIKNYKTPGHVAFNAGLFGSATASLLLTSFNDPKLAQLVFSLFSPDFYKLSSIPFAISVLKDPSTTFLIMGAISAAFFAPTIQDLKETIAQNKKQINMSR